MSLAMIAVALVLTACWPYSGVARPEQVVDPDAVGLVDLVDRSDPSVLMVALGDGRVVTIDTERAADLGGPGVSSGRLLLYGSDGEREWYRSSSTSASSPTPDCYFISADAAYDEPGAVVFVFLEMRDVGIRVRKAEGFVTPTKELTSQGQYPQGEVAHDLGSFCLNAEGLVFGFP